MTFFVAVVALVDLALGYYLAVRFGYGPPGVIEAWEALCAARAPMAGNEPAALREGQPEPPAARAPEADQHARPPTAPVQGLGEHAPLCAAPAETDEQSQTGGAGSQAAQQTEAAHQTALDHRPAQAAAELEERRRGSRIPNAAELDEKYVEVCILKLNVAMLESGDRCTQLDSRLRACRGQTDAATIAECLRLLEEDCRTYLAAQSRAAEQLRQRVDEFGQLSDLAEEIELANLEQAAQIETTLSNLQHMDFASDREAASTRLLTELAKLREARDRLHDNQEAAFLAVARHQQRLDKIEPRLHHDPLTGLMNRIGLEVTLAQWWQEGRQRLRTITAALLDIDAFGALNQEHGPAVADRVLAGLGCVLRTAASEMELLGRFSGQQFLLLKLDEGTRAAIKRGETIRQTIERSTFRADGREVRLTVSAGYAAAKPDDTLPELFDRLRAALKQAKQTGANQAFFHDGQRIEQINSPHLGAKPVELTV